MLAIKLNSYRNIFGLMNSRDLLQKTLNHQEPDRIVFDMGSNAVTGIHVKTLENLCKYYGLEKRPVR